MINIYEEAKRQMKPEEIDHWRSDLYLKVTPVSKRLVEEYEYQNLVTMFKNIHYDDSGSLWYDIPFAYLPYCSRH